MEFLKFKQLPYQLILKTFGWRKMKGIREIILDISYLVYFFFKKKGEGREAKILVHSILPHSQYLEDREDEFKYFKYIYINNLT